MDIILSRQHGISPEKSLGIRHVIPAFATVADLSAMLEGQDPEAPLNFFSISNEALPTVCTRQKRSALGLYDSDTGIMVWQNGIETQFTNIENTVLGILHTPVDTVHDYAEIINALYPAQSPNYEPALASLKTHICNIRKKLPEEYNTAIRTIRSRGYLLRTAVDLSTT